MGTTAVAYGASRRSRPKREFLHITARDRKDKLKHQDRKNWKANWRAEKRQYKHYVSHMHSPELTVQERRHKKRQSKPRTSSRLLVGTGSIMIVAGRALPVLAYGYVAYDIARRVRADDEVTTEEVVDEIWQVSLAPQAMAISQYQPSMAPTNLLSKMVFRLA